MNTYSLIASETVSGSATTSVTFSDIPQIYDDIVLRYSAKVNVSAWSANLVIRANSDSSNIYRYHVVAGGTATATATSEVYFWSLTSQGLTSFSGANMTGTDPTDTFGVGEVYFFEYANKTKVKTFYGNSSSQGNTTTSGTIYRKAFHGMIDTLNPITSMVLSYGVNFVAGTRFSLYGIKG